MFIDALKGIADLDVLFYVRPEIDCSPPSIAHWQRILSERWETNLRLLLCSGSAHLDSARRWQSHGREMLSVFQQPGYTSTSGPREIQALRQCLLRNPDIIFAHRMVSMCPLLLSRTTLPPVYFDMDDVEHIAFLRSIDRTWPWHSRMVQYLKLPAIIYGEQRAGRLAQRTFVCSEEDRTHLKKNWLLPRVEVIPNGVDPKPLLPVTPEKTLLFVGSFKYKPNLDAARFLIQEIWPRVLEGIPAARLIVAGIFSETVEFFKGSFPGVEFAGFVKDLDALYTRSRIVCAPILSGGGTRVKILEAAAYGKPVVSTRLGAEGLGLRDGFDLLERDGAESFAAACLQLLVEDKLCEQLGSNARSAVAKRFQRESVVRLIQERIGASLVENGRRRDKAATGLPTQE